MDAAERQRDAGGEQSIPAERIPYVLGATGHRTLVAGDVAGLRGSVRAILRGLRARMPDTPLVLLNALAEGADQLVAEVALEEGVHLIAVLPMPEEIYRRTMSEEAQRNFDVLLQRAARRIELDCEHTQEAMRGSEAVRARCYEYLAQWLGSACQGLIALWDGEESGKRGGTDQVVRLVRDGVPDERPGAESDPAGVVYHVMTRRSDEKEARGDLHSIRVLAQSRRRGSGKPGSGPGPERGSDFDLLETHMQDFNRSAAKVAIPAYSALVTGPEQAALSPFARRVEAFFRHADAVSINARKKRQQYFASILTLAVIGSIFFMLHVEFWPTEALTWLLMPLFLVAAMVLHWRATKSRVEEMYIGARALAEALRVQFFWEMAAIRKPVADYYLMHYRAEADWIRAALRNVWLLRGCEPAATPTPEVMAAIKRYWMDDQRDWYLNKAKKQKKLVEEREALTRVALWVLVLWSLIVPLCLKFLETHWMPEGWRHLARNERLFGSLHLVGALVALVAGVSRLWAEQQGYEEQAREYERIGRLLRTHSWELGEGCEATAETRQVLEQIGVEVLDEHGRWLHLHRDRPLQVMASA